MRFTLWSLSLLALASLSSCVTVLQRSSAIESSAELDSIPHSERHYAKSARSKIRKAYQISTLQPEDATVLFLTAARELEPYYTQNTWAYHAYQHALGMGIELTQVHNYWGRTLTAGNSSIQLPMQCRTVSSTSKIIDKLEFSGKYHTPALTPEIIEVGKGVSLVGFTHWTAEREKRSPFLPRVGQIYSVTATAHWSTPNKVDFTLEDSRLSPNLSANYSVPTALYEAETKEHMYQGIVHVLRPEKGLESMSLYSLEPVDPKRIPVILVHGLAASPNLWVKPSHKLLQDNSVRDNYQFYAYFYPTGLPLAHTAAGLKKEIRQLEKHLKQRGAGENARQMVVIGHSMGGLLTSAITRDYRGASSELYTKNIDDITAKSDGKEAIRELLEQPPLDCVSRAIFIATPHRGSKYADNWLGQFTSHLIEIPENIVGIDPMHYRHDLTQAGKEIFNMQEGMDGIQRLRFDNPALKYNLTRPKLPQVRYHSIIGDRGWGGQLKNSSDGIVAYSSSHLAGVESEVVVPAWHNAQDNPATIGEIIRILHLHTEEQ